MLVGAESTSHRGDTNDTRYDCTMTREEIAPRWCECRVISDECMANTTENQKGAF